MEHHLTDEQRDWLNRKLAEEQTHRLALGAMHRLQDKDWESWTPKQRAKARKNMEFYGEDRPL